jgi:hypothetical protein
MTRPTDDVDRLLAQLKELPLIDHADLDAEGVAYAAFEPLLSAILRAALVQVPQKDRPNNNRRLFQRFVVDHFPPGRGRHDPVYAEALWGFRCYFVKDERTGSSFLLTHHHPDLHWVIADGRRVLNLESLVADFREAVDNLGTLLRGDPELRQSAEADVAQRELTSVSIAPRGLPSVTMPQAASATDLSSS